MRFTTRALATAAMAVAAGAVAIPAAQASDPAVTSCAFTPLYSTYQDGQLSGLQTYIPGTKQLTVSAGDGKAWFVTVEDTAHHTGWMPATCVAFLA